MTLPTNRTTANTAAEHVADHNTLHAEYNTPTHTHSGAYAPLSTNVWVGPDRFAVYIGSPLFSNQLGWAGWLMDAASDEGITASLMLPEGWATLAVDGYWANAAAGSGNVQFTLVSSPLAVGAALNAGTDVYPGAAAAGAQNIVVKTVLSSSITAPTAAELFKVRVDRFASFGTDTLPNDIIFLGVNLRKVT